MVRHEAQLEGDPLWHIQPVEFVVQESRQTTIKLPCHIMMLCLELVHSNLVLVGFICRQFAAIQWPMSVMQ